MSEKCLKCNKGAAEVDGWMDGIGQIRECRVCHEFEDQQRKKRAEDQMAGEILRAVFSGEISLDAVSYDGACGPQLFIEASGAKGTMLPPHGRTIPELHAAMKQAGML